VQQVYGMLMAGDPAPAVGEHAGADQSPCDQNAVRAVFVCSLEVTRRRHGFGR